MASFVYNVCAAEALSGDIDLASGGDTLKCALLTSSYTPSKDHLTYADLSGEVSGTGYTSGGATLTSQSVTRDDTNDEAVFDAANVTWSSATITARYAVIYDTTNSNSLICCIDFGSDQSSSAGDFTISWNANGIFAITC